ncbi:MarR family transcriptional regulator [Methanoregula sp.]|uniref:MarR family winged helix-turn-helix transcriptional regulator n=1 Tax=Methanoregula sp. TaxID=2052170 RepID=UPI002BEC5805|nr:MarR family transcriptional regulator [Methanoregula sp.]HVP96469.1 MarR family transcriptional regulator [Methanoregula sp.]
MADPREQLFGEFEKLLRIRNECSCRIFSDCGLSEMTVRQIAYLRTIDEEGNMTFSRLAEITNTSKPTVTEMVNRFVRMDCAYRESCPDDRRIAYIHLTEKGKAIAQAEHAALRRLVERMAETLDEDELDLLVGILRKIR